MLFTSVFYLLFLALVALANYALPVKYRTHWLLAAGYFFYFTWQPAFSVVLFCETILSFLLGRKIASSGDKKEKKKWLVGGIILLFLPLAFFKYHNFFNDNLARALSLFSLENPIPAQPFLVPLGISFFTFQAVSYVVDIYRGYLKPESRLEKYALYMAFFPTLLAGPIERAKSILTQIGNPVPYDYQNIRAGLQLILWGVFKKVVLADRITDFVNTVYAEPETMPGALIYFAIVLSVFQFFCDFSAYSDIAVGSGRILGFRLTKNFDDRVYAAPSREIFWQGWHRSLTGWLRDYVFLPLSRHARSRARLYINLLIVYLLVGFWHGATWGFIIWGFLNGIWLVGEQVTKKARRDFFSSLGIDINGAAFNFFAWLLVFNSTAFFGVFFRTGTPAEAFTFIANLANSNTNLLENPGTRRCLITIGLLIFMDLINRQIPQNENFDTFVGRQNLLVRWALYVLLAEMIIFYSFAFTNANFLYFQF